MSFYADEMVELRHSDCLNPATGLACLSDSSIDVRITDPLCSDPVHAWQASSDESR